MGILVLASRGGIAPDCSVCGFPGAEVRAWLVSPDWSDSVSTPIVVCRRASCRETALRREAAGQLGRGAYRFYGWHDEQQPPEPVPLPAPTLDDDRALLRLGGAKFSRWFHQ